MVNTINDNIEENKPLNWENIESFDEDAYWKNISELNKEKVEQKKEDKIFRTIARWIIGRRTQKN